jgi:predicted TIM-barrel fold metal-dependent hydrolase
MHADRPRLDYALYDADEHYYEPDDCFTRHIEAKFRGRTARVERTEPGKPGRMYVGGTRCHFFSVGAGDSVGPPGVMKEFLRGTTDHGGNPGLQPIDALAVPEFTQRVARLHKMDVQDVEACLILPTMGVGLEAQLREDPDVLYPSLRAFNRWLEEDWGFGSDGRLFGAPLCSLFDLDEGVRELDRLLAAGARFVILTAGPPAPGRSPAEPFYAPFWARCEEAGVNVVFHIGRTPFSEMYNVPWGLRPHPPSHRHSLMEYHLSFTERPVADTLTALVADDLFGRFPALKVLSVEYGSSWVAPLVKKLDAIARLYSKDMRRFGRPDLAPGDLFRRNVWVVPFYEDDVVGLTTTLGVEHVLGGSDYPHPEGLLWPSEFVEELGGLDAGAVRRIMRENLAALVV